MEIYMGKWRYSSTHSYFCRNARKLSLYTKYFAIKLFSKSENSLWTSPPPRYSYYPQHTNFGKALNLIRTRPEHFYLKLYICRKEFFFLPPRTDRLWGLHCLLSNGHHDFFSPVVKRPGREADHTPPSSAEVNDDNNNNNNNAWSYTSTHPIRLHGVILNET
jgi:hypothetical protein